MTVPQYGQVTPLQAFMLSLGGIAERVPGEVVQDLDRVDTMKRALRFLQKRTGQDFGYDIEQWHQFLQASDEFSEEYTFELAWKAVLKAVKKVIADPERLRLVELAQKPMDEKDDDQAS